MQENAKTTWLPTAIPRLRQLEYQGWERGLFLHFGIRTFHEGHHDFDGKTMDPARFNPIQLDCSQWARTARAAGFRYMVMTAKHHDGFANWPTRLTPFSVKSTPWREGKGDVVREFTDACRRHGLAVGLYYSPADVSCPVYSDPKAYDDYFINQISELLTGYGDIDMLWFDGCGSEGHTYDWPRIIGEIRRMQPRILIFGGADADYGWIGNESGLAPTPNWNTVNAVPISVQTSAKDPAREGRPTWIPFECDCRLRWANWFYSDEDEHTVKSIEELMGLYYYSVGRGRNLLINIGPDRRGLLPDADAARIIEFGAEIRRRFGNPLAMIADFKAGERTWDFLPKPPDPVLVDHVVAQEDLTGGEHVRRFRVQIFPAHYGDPITVFEGHNMGYKAICRFPLVAARQVRLEILEADGPVRLAGLALHNTAGKKAS